MPAQILVLPPRRSLKQQLQRKPGSWHWYIIVERRP
jgi:hypothetical protein